jgi:DNA-binding transcriptional regulator YiaG
LALKYNPNKWKRFLFNTGSKIMPNIATVLKDEITRLARKEIKNETAVFKKTSAQHRRNIAELKRQVSSLQKQVSILEKQALRDTPVKVVADEDTNFRFTAKGLRSQRKRLGISAADYGKLVGVAIQTVYNWESEISRPRKQQLTAIAAIRSIGKKEVQVRLEQLNKGGRNK